MKSVNIRLTEAIYEWVKEQAEFEGVPVSAMIRTLLDRMKHEDEMLKKLNIKKRGK